MQNNNMRRIESIDAKSEPQKSAETYKPVDVTKEQIAEVLARLRSFAYWNFHSKYATSRLDTTVIKWRDREIKFSIAEDGLYKIVLDNGQICYFDVRTVCKPVAEKGSLDNIQTMAKITNSEDLLPDDLEFCKSYIPNVIWFFMQATSAKMFMSFDQSIMGHYVKNLDQMISYSKITK